MSGQAGENCNGRVVSCLINPCAAASCPAFPSAKCVPDFCNGCSAKFFVRGVTVTEKDCEGKKLTDTSGLDLLSLGQASDLEMALLTLASDLKEFESASAKVLSKTPGGAGAQPLLRVRRDSKPFPIIRALLGGFKLFKPKGFPLLDIFGKLMKGTASADKDFKKMLDAFFKLLSGILGITGKIFTSIG